MDDTGVGAIFQQSDGLRQIRIPSGRHTFYAASEESVMVPIGLNLATGSNYTTRKMWLEGTITHTFTPGMKYKISSKMYHRGTFDSQFVAYTITPPSGIASNVSSSSNSRARQPAVELLPHIPENNLHSDFYGLWRNKNSETCNISATELIISNGDVIFAVKINSIAKVGNINTETNKNYPNGFLFYGEITSITGGTIPNVGNIGDTYRVTYYLHTRGKSFISNKDDLIWNKQ
jgi:hypothetical protein